MKNSKFSLFVALTLVAVSSNCAGRKIVKDQVDSVKSVAVVGFALQQRMPNTATGVLAAMTEHDSGPMPGLKAAPIAQPAEHARIMYDSLQKELAQRMHWKVLARTELERQPAYSALFAEKTKQPQFRPMVSGSNVEMFIPEGIVESFLLNSMSFQERQALIRALNVDAIAVASVQIELVNEGGLKKLVGAGELHPQAKLGFYLYNATQEDAIWMDLNADGEESSDGTDHVLGFANVDALNRQAISTANSAIHSLIAHYQGG